MIRLHTTYRRSLALARPSNRARHFGGKSLAPSRCSVEARPLRSLSHRQVVKESFDKIVPCVWSVKYRVDISLFRVYLFRVADTIPVMTVPGKGGRPAMGKRRDVKLTDEQWETLRRIGEGQAARGLRRLIERHASSKPESNTPTE